MGVPASEVGYTPAMPRRQDHEVHKDMWWPWEGGGYIVHSEAFPFMLDNVFINIFIYIHIFVILSHKLLHMLYSQGL